MKRIVILLSTMLAVAPATAGERAGIVMPDTIAIAGKTLQLNGMGLREATWLKIDVYVAGLYVEHASSNASAILASDEAKVIMLKFKRDVGSGDIVKAWNEGFANNATVPLAKLKPLIAQLDSWMPSFAKGDTLSFVLIPGQGVTVAINGKRKGTLGDDDFARSLLAIWLGPKPPSNSLKTGMLGRHPGA